MKLSNTKIRIGGLLRCCIQTWRSEIGLKPDKKVKDGDVLECKYCQDGKMVLEDGVWKWGREAKQ